MLFIATITWIGRGGFVDANGDGISVLDAIYYSTVTVTTTGYGDIYPSSPAARAWTAFAVTPLRILFLIVLVGTTLAVLTERFREALSQNRWRRRVNDHIIIAGYGTKGRGAADSLLASGTTKEHIVVIDVLADVIEEARSRGFTGVLGDATRTSVLTEAMVQRDGRAGSASTRAVAAEAGAYPRSSCRGGPPDQILGSRPRPRRP